MIKIYWLAVPDETINNLGDHAQILGIRQFFNYYFCDCQVIEVKSKDSYAWVKSTNINRYDLIFIQSGGHFGDFSLFMHNLRKKVLTKFPDNLVIQLPVSVYYYKPGSVQNDYKFFKDKKFLCFGRSKLDTHILNNIIGSAFYCPDFAFMLENIKPGSNGTGTLLSFRKDFESKFPFTDLVKMLPDNRLSRTLTHNISLLTWIPVYTRIKLMSNEKVYFFNPQFSTVPITETNRKNRVYSCINYYKKYRLVITNHFHTKVFCELSGTPYVFNFNKTPGKHEPFSGNEKKYFPLIASFLRSQQL